MDDDLPFPTRDAAALAAGRYAASEIGLGPDDWIGSIEIGDPPDDRMTVRATFATLRGGFDVPEMHGGFRTIEGAFAGCSGGDELMGIVAEVRVPREEWIGFTERIEAAIRSILHEATKHGASTIPGYFGMGRPTGPDEAPPEDGRRRIGLGRAIDSETPIR